MLHVPQFCGPKKKFNRYSTIIKLGNNDLTADVIRQLVLLCKSWIINYLRQSSSVARLRIYLLHPRWLILSPLHYGRLDTCIRPCISSRIAPLLKQFNRLINYSISEYNVSFMIGVEPTLYVTVRGLF